MVLRPLPCLVAVNDLVTASEPQPVMRHCVAMPRSRRFGHMLSGLAFVTVLLTCSYGSGEPGTP
jgi:hypothetical protein